MKKLLLVLSIGAFAACNSSSSSESTADTTAKAADTVKAAVVDTAKTMADTSAAGKAKVDSVKK